MAIEFVVNKYKAKEKFTLKYEKDGQPKEEVIDILLTFDEADEILEFSKKKEADPKYVYPLDRFAEILFGDKLDFVKEATGKGFDDCVVSVGFQFMAALYKEKMKFITSTKSMGDFLNKK